MVLEVDNLLCPIAVAKLWQGLGVLDLSSSGGIDMLPSAPRVAETWFAPSVDMTYEILDLARDNAAQPGDANVKFLKA